MLTWLSNQEMEYLKEMLFLRVHVKLCSRKFLTGEIIKLQYGFLVSWIEEEQRIKDIVSNISEDFVSHMYVSREKKKGKSQEDRASKTVSLLIKVKFSTIFFLMLYLISFSLSQLSVLFHFAGRIHTAVNHTVHIYFPSWYLFYIFLHFKVTIFLTLSRPNPAPI